MALSRYSSQAQPQAQPASLQNPHAYRYSNAQAMAIDSIGNSIGNAVSIKQAMDAKYQEHLDDLKTYQIKDAVKLAEIDIDSVYENEKDPAKWESLINKRVQKAKDNIYSMMGDVSQERRQFLEQQVESFGEIQAAKMQSLRLKTVSNQNLVAGLASYEQAIENEGEDSETAKLIYDNMQTKHRDWFVSMDDFDLKMGEVRDRATRKHKEGIREGNRESVAEMVQSGAFTDTSGSIDKNALSSAVNQMTEDATERAELFSYGNSIASMYKEQKDVDTDNLQNSILMTLFEHRNDSPEERFNRGNELAKQLKSSGVEPSRMGVLLSSIEQFQSVKPNLNYDPHLAGQLQNEAEAAESTQNKNDVLQKAITAYNEGKIKDSDLETITKSAEKSYNTFIGQKKQALVDDFRYIVTKGYATGDEVSWLKTQLATANAEGKSVDVDQLRQKWLRASQARQWIVNEYNQLLEQQVDRIEKEQGRTLDEKEIRTIGLSIQRFWLKKSDSQLVDLYNQWLNK